MKKKCAVLFSFGEGGHTAQMKRLAPKIVESLKEVEIVSLSDTAIIPEWSDFHYKTSEVRGKHSHFSIFINSGPILVVKSIVNINIKHDIKCMVTTGPGIGMFSAVICKLFGSKVIHIETWSRFNSRSLTGRCMYLIADEFYIQNKSLRSLYPKAIYSGVL
ncbi:PssD/Cps14F family polysaccharide biosynthesis glycosyltransferase [Vibrio lentus]